MCTHMCISCERNICCSCWNSEHMSMGHHVMPIETAREEKAKNQQKIKEHEKSYAMLYKLSLNLQIKLNEVTKTIDALKILRDTRNEIALNTPVPSGYLYSRDPKVCAALQVYSQCQETTNSTVCRTSHRILSETIPWRSGYCTENLVKRPGTVGQSRQVFLSQTNEPADM